MDDFAARIKTAQTDSRALESLVADYLPFIKKETGKFGGGGLEYDDKISLGMLVFANCVRQYSEQRGAFLAYAAVCIRNRLTDEVRRLARDKGSTVTLSVDEDDEMGTTVEEKASLALYSKEKEQHSLQEEIATLAGQLALYGLSFGELAKICPKQSRSRALCAGLAQQVMRDDSMLAAFQGSSRLPQKELARQAGVSEKTIEKYRRYIVALLIILQGDYPGIGAYIPGYREVE